MAVIAKNILNGKETWYPSIRDGARSTGTLVQSIRSALQKGSKCNGRLWRFAKEGEENTLPKESDIRVELRERLRAALKEIESVCMQAIELGES